MVSKSFIETKCRAEAIKLLNSYYVGSPDEIELDVIASICKLSIEYGMIDSCEGRLISNKTGGIIRIRNNIINEGRKRFTIAHEIGHYRMHNKGLIIDHQQDLRSWNNQSMETEANLFAAELLMPEFLFKPDVLGEEPSWKLVNNLSKRYKASKIATALQMIEYSNEPCALVYSHEGKITWCKWNKCFSEFYYFIPINKNLHRDSIAQEIIAKKEISIFERDKTFAYAWLDGYNQNDYEEIWEDSWKYEDDIFSIIFVDEDIKKRRY